MFGMVNYVTEGFHCDSVCCLLVVLRGNRCDSVDVTATLVCFHSEWTEDFTVMFGHQETCLCLGVISVAAMYDTCINNALVVG